MRAVVAAVATAFGLTVAFLSAALGHCSAFGGLCPSPPQPWWQDDVFGGVLSGVALAAFAIVVALRPDGRGVMLAVGTAVAVSLPVAMIVSRAAHAGL